MPLFHFFSRTKTSNSPGASVPLLQWNQDAKLPRRLCPTFPARPRHTKQSASTLLNNSSLRRKSRVQTQPSPNLLLEQYSLNKKIIDVWKQTSHYKKNIENTKERACGYRTSVIGQLGKTNKWQKRGGRESHVSFENSPARPF